jgi:hypothetical protein
MIGVISKSEEKEVVEEFFQLFKTPWEFYHPERSYEVLIASPGEIPETDSSLVIIYGAEPCVFDREVVAENNSGDLFVTWKKIRIPIYDKAITFANAAQPILISNKPGQAIGFETAKKQQKVLRIGYDLFREVYFLLTQGQPAQNALIPTLDLHIEMLRTWVLETGIGLVEIPPVPDGFNFMVCLTHDVDFIGMRYHFGDHSMWGFLYRASIGSLLKYVKGKIDLPKLLINLKSAGKLPLVYLGLAKDPWDQFDSYLELEKGLGSSYFFIPFKNKSGIGFHGKKGKYRAAKYDVDDADPFIRKLLKHNCEVGVHGIDAWHSVENGKKELQRIGNKTGSQDRIGIRMHWLAGNEKTFETLDKAGFAYDSTFGYNETIGFKAGTAQVYKPLGANDLLELPLHIQDTALLGAGRMNTADDEAMVLCEQLFEIISNSKGVLTLLWHQRSLGPERLWGNFYNLLIKKLQEKEVWFGTARDIVEWFQIRRSAEFYLDLKTGWEVKVRKDLIKNPHLPPLVLYEYKPQKQLSTNESSGGTAAPEHSSQVIIKRVALNLYN